MAVSRDTSLIAVVSSTFVALHKIEHTHSPTFLRMGSTDALGEAGCDGVMTTTEEIVRVTCTLGDARGVVLNSDASLAAVCTDSGLLLVSSIFGDAAEYDERGTAPRLTVFNCTHLGASTKGCSVACFTGARQLLIVDDANHLVLLRCENPDEEVGDTNEDVSTCAICPPSASPMPVTLQRMVDGHICSCTARVTAVACSHSGAYGESIVVLGLSNGTVQVLNGQTLKALRTWGVQEAVTNAFISSDAGAVASSHRRSRPSQVASLARLGMPDTVAAAAASPEVTIYDVCVGAHLITLCTSHGVVYYSRFTFQLESAYTQLLATPLVQVGGAAATEASVLHGTAMRGGLNGRWAYIHVFDGVLYFSPRDVDTQHTLEVRSVEGDMAREDIVHAHAPLPATWLDSMASGRPASRSFVPSQASLPKPAKGSGYTAAPWSVQQERRLKAQTAVARNRKAQAFGAATTSAVASKNALHFQYDFASIFSVGRPSLTRMEAASSALRGLHTRAVMATAFTTAGDALIAAGGDGRIQQLHFPIARAKGTDGLAGRIFAGHAAAVTAVDTNLSRQHPLVLSGGADGCLRIWSPGVRDTPVAECTVGCGGCQVARAASGNSAVAAQFFYLDKFVLSCAADALELRRNPCGICALPATASLSSTYDTEKGLSRAPLYRFSVGIGHSITSATAVNHFASNVVFLATSEKEVQLLDVAANTVLWREGTTHSRGIYRVATGRTSRYAGADVSNAAAHLFMSASLDSTAALWDVRMAKPAQLFTQHSNTGVPSLALEVAPGIGVVAVASQDNGVYMYDLRGGCGAVALDVLRGLDSYATSLAWHPLRPVLVAGLASGDVHVLQHTT
ncbi:putative WD domain, G-beta repeat [Leishmania utingensis]|uniref:WD domain, G-beta repeat n=1 Tax=Leishmania utingensis TaxID=653362 RepID=A0AAW3A8V7_9TRYP